mmetsp:Transcript_49338/g.138748  ORF Transcript_49338/g.138748 Transcript_49338/m.138748 type:complete len:175 (-) Transcript_49338:46-570(-)
MPKKSLKSLRACEGVEQGFYMCRFCDRWQRPGSFSREQLALAEAQGPSGKPVALCVSCAKVALRAEEQTAAPVDEDEEEAPSDSLPVECRYALILAFTGEYDGLPALGEDVLRRILGYAVRRVAPFIADLGDGYRCTACQRDFPSLAAVRQHARSSQRHVKAVRAAAGGGGDAG